MPTPQTDSRHSTPLVPVLMTQLDAPATPSNADWLGHGLIARGCVTLFTSQWKVGKTTLLAGLIQQFAAGGKFLDRPFFSPWFALKGTSVRYGPFASGRGVASQAVTRTPVRVGRRSPSGPRPPPVAVGSKRSN